ncbi:MAG: SDR family oxidoreductase [Christiangramia sp.]
MNILIIGGTGKTGKEIIKQGLELGYSITALVRNPMKIKINHPKLIIKKGNVLKPESFGDTFQGKDAVLSALGHKRFIIKSTILSEGTKNIIAEMQKQKVKRFICITSLGINDSRFKLGLYYTLFTIPFILFFYFLDKSKQEKIIKQSNLNWTIVRPGQLTNGKKRTKYKHGENVGNYILTKTISRADVAHFMLNQIKDKKYLYKTPGLTY